VSFCELEPTHVVARDAGRCALQHQVHARCLAISLLAIDPQNPPIERQITLRASSNELRGDRVRESALYSTCASP